MFNNRRINTQIDFSTNYLALSEGGNGRYIYRPNWSDQTVSVIDTDPNPNTVVATVTLTASKNFCMIFYCAINESVYLLGQLYFNRIDADPASGTFNTVVEEGATLIPTSAGLYLSYLPAPFDGMASVISLVNSPIIFPRSRWNDNKFFTNWFSQDSRFTDRVRNGHNNVRNVFLLPHSKLLAVSGGTSRQFFARIHDNCHDVITTGRYTFKRIDNAAPDLFNDSGGVYAFGNCFVGTSSNWLLFNDYSFSPLFSKTVSGVLDSPFFEFAPNAGKLFAAQKSVIGGTGRTVQAWSVGRDTFSNLGTIDRTAYAATNETTTDDILYNPYSGLIYVNGSGSLTTGVDKVHVYDPTQAIGSMYQYSITVGQGISATRAGALSLNGFCMNQTHYRESPNVII